MGPVIKKRQYGWRIRERGMANKDVGTVYEYKFLRSWSLAMTCSLQVMALPIDCIVQNRTKQAVQGSGQGAASENARAVTGRGREIQSSHIF